MLCEMCGVDKGRLRTYEVEGVTMQLCVDCGKFGKEAEVEVPRREARPPQTEIRSGSGFQTPGMARSPPTQRRARKDALSRDELELVLDYPQRIRKGRESKGMSHEDLGKKINEKKSVIAKLESGNFRPNDALISKLEKFLGIKLKEVVDDVPIGTKDLGGPMTLGDLIKYEK